MTPDNPNGTKVWRDCALLVALALSLRTAYLLVTPRILDSADAIHYIEAARHFATGDFVGFNAKIPILYPMLGALAHFLNSDYEWALAFVSLAASTLLILPVYALSRDLHGARAARTACILISVWPWLIDYASRPGPDALGCTLWFSSVWLFSRALRRGGLWIAAALVSFIALHLTRAEGTVLIAAAFVGAFILILDPRSGSLRRFIPFAVGCVVCLAAYAAYMHFVTGSATVNYRIQFILHDFSFPRFASAALRSFSDVLPVMIGPVPLLFAGVGLFHRRRDDMFPRDLRLEFFVLFFAAAQWFISLFVLSTEPRYLMSVVVTFGLWAARGISLVSDDWAKHAWGRFVRWLPIAGTVFLMLIGSVASIGVHFLDRQPTQPVEYKTVGLWMRDNLPPGLIFTRKPQVGYYADMPTTGPNKRDTLAQAIERAKSVHARYVVVDERYSVKIVPGIAPLLDPALAPKDLIHLKTFDPYPASRVQVYAVAEQPTAPPPQ